MKRNIFLYVVWVVGINGKMTVFLVVLALMLTTDEQPSTGKTEGVLMSKKRNNKKPSLAYQLRNAVNMNFSEGTSKRAAKMSSGGTGATVYSYKHRDSLIDIASQLGHFCKSEFGISLAKDIKSEHIDSFLKEKSKTCSDSTLKTYHTNLSKLNKCVNSAYNRSCKENWSEGVSIPSGTNQTKLRDAKISRESMNKVLGALNLNHASHRALALAESLGLRASETVKVKGSHIDLEKRVVSVQGKGGRFREVPIPERSVGLLSGFKEQFGEERIAPVKPDSVNEIFKRIREREDVHDLDGIKSGVHAIRKLWATESFEEKVSNGMSEKDAWGDVSEALGHGRDRQDLFKVYVVKD